MTDLLLRGGRVYDPARSISNQALDIAVSDGRITRVDTNIDPAGFATVIDVAEKIVTPGLIDLHTHVYHGFNPTGVHPDVAGVGSGVTTVLDAGSGVPANFG